MTLLELLCSLSLRREFAEYIVERARLETAFLEVIENRVAGEDAKEGRKWERSGLSR